MYCKFKLRVAKSLVLAGFRRREVQLPVAAPLELVANHHRRQERQVACREVACLRRQSPYRWLYLGLYRLSWY